MINSPPLYAKFLQGYFSAGQLNLQKYNHPGRFYYILSSSDPITIQRLLESFLEIGVYPGIDKDEYRIVIQDKVGFQALIKHRIPKPTDVKKLKEIVTKFVAKEYTPADYYHARSVVQQERKAGNKVVLKRLAKQLGINYGTLRYWTADLNGKREEQQVLPIVKRYEQILSVLGLPNPYLATEPVKWRDRWLYPLEGEFYEMTPKAQAGYLKKNGIEETVFDADCAEQIFANLKRQLSGDNKRDFSFKIKGHLLTSVCLLDSYPDEGPRATTKRSGHQGNYANAIYC